MLKLIDKEGAEMTRFLDLGLDAQQTIGLSKDPLDHIETIDEKYKVIRKLENSNNKYL